LDLPSTNRNRSKPPSSVTWISNRNWSAKRPRSPAGADRKPPEWNDNAWVSLAPAGESLYYPLAFDSLGNLYGVQGHSIIKWLLTGPTPDQLRLANVGAGTFLRAGDRFNKTFRITMQANPET
jgi:hypothetical protein